MYLINTQQITIILYNYDELVCSLIDSLGNVLWCLFDLAANLHPAPVCCQARGSLDFHPQRRRSALVTVTVTCGWHFPVPVTAQRPCDPSNCCPSAACPAVSVCPCRKELSVEQPHNIPCSSPGPGMLPVRDHSTGCTCCSHVELIQILQYFPNLLEGTQ